MKNIAASTRRAPDDDHAWMGDAGVPRSREDRVAEIVTLIALVFSLGIGLVIALLPVSAKAISVRIVPRSLQFSVVETIPPAAWSVRCQPCSAQQAASTGGRHEPSVLRRN
jgi:hypothetical protein